MTLFVFGLGFSARRFSECARGRFPQIVATVTDPDKARALETETGLSMRAFGPDTDDPRIPADLAAADALLVSVPPDRDGDPVLRRFHDDIAKSRIGWIGYLSTIGVYGDQGGAWIDEATPTAPTSERTRRRVEVERAWLELGARTGKAVQVFRLAGIYGPGRNPFVKLAEGRAQRIVKPGQVFNRIHADDIAAVLAASLDRPRPGAVYNVADDEPAPPQDVVALAAEMAGVAPPPETPFAGAPMSPMARGFYGENKRVRNRLIADELGVRLAYPTYREGLAALKDAEAGRFAR